ncbi:MAG: hypothetical protein IKU06_11075 [Lachnospiraceae bacterium]|nr:hypothetical protein [Lachnospiraceae bacterium]
MITGTISNAVRQDFLSKKWDAKKKSGNILSKQDKNSNVSKTPEQSMLERFREEMKQNKENSKINGIANKVTNGEDLSPEEEQYLAEKNPGLLNSYRQAKLEQKAYEEKLKNCETKDEVQRLKTNTVNGYLSEMSAAKGTGNKGAIVATAKKVLAKLKNIEKAEIEFIKSGAYSNLPTEADEQIEETRETVEENERLLEEISQGIDDNKELIEETEIVSAGNAVPAELSGVENEELAGSTEEVDKAMDKVTDKAAEKTSSRTEKDIFSEFEKVLKKFIPDNADDDREDRHNKKTKAPEIGGMINIIV